jgi:hypothetical protein
MLLYFLLKNHLKKPEYSIPRSFSKAKCYMKVPETVLDKTAKSGYNERGQNMPGKGNK